MRVLSIDPGRRHCAVCLLEVGQECRGADDTVLFWQLTDMGSSSVPHVIESARRIEASIRASLPAAATPPNHDDQQQKRPFDLVIIEQQVGSNHVMCRVMDTLHAYFLLGGATVALVDPKRKYAYLAKAGLYDGGFPSGRPGAKLSPYHRKRISALAIGAWVRAGGADRAHLLEFYTSHKKQDDLADALLQAFEHCHWQALLEQERESAPPPDPLQFVPLKEKQLRKKHWSPENIMFLLQDHGDSFEAMMQEIKRQGRAMRREICKAWGHTPTDVNYEQCFRVLRASLAARTSAPTGDLRSEAEQPVSSATPQMS